MNRKLKIFLYSLLGILSFLVISFLVLYLALNEELPQGSPGPEADEFAAKILKRVQHENYESTDVIQWTFRNKNNYFWKKDEGVVEVKWDKVFVKLNTSKPAQSLVFDQQTEITGDQKDPYIQKALKNFNNDSFWIVAPHKLFDSGTTRKLVTLENGQKALLVTYSSGGSTPGDSYLWNVDQSYLPVSYKMWVSILPIGGLEATWENWKTTASGILVPQKHQILGIDIPMSNIKAWRDASLEN